LQRVLVSPLGLSPGVVTGAFYALRDEGYGTMDKVVTIGTGKDLVRLCEKEIATELKEFEQECGTHVEYEARHIAANEVRNADDVRAFAELLEALLQEHEARNDMIYLSLTGGHKSMAAAVALAAQLHKPALVFHLFVEETVQQGGDIRQVLRRYGEAKRRCLNPPREQRSIVEIPLLPVGEERDDLWSALFEIRVAEWLAERHAYPIVRHSFYPPYLKALDTGDVDVYLRDLSSTIRRVLVGECKLRTGDNPDAKPVNIEEVHRHHQRVAQVRVKEEQEASDFGASVKVYACLVSNTTQVEPDAKAAAAQAHIELLCAQLPGNWKERADWKVVALTRIA